MKYRVKYNKAYNLPIVTTKYVLDLVQSFLGTAYDPEEWEDKARSPRERRIILYALRETAYNPAKDRRDQLIQLCRKYSTHQPRYWPRFLRERYQFAITRDFFAVLWPDIIAEFNDYETEMFQLGADPAATGKVFDPAPAYALLTSTMKELISKIKATEKPRRGGIVKQ